MNLNLSVKQNTEMASSQSSSAGMKQVKGFWLPETEQHLVPFLENGPEFADGPTYQIHKLLAALPFVKNFGNAIDVGGHCGLWSRVMVHFFNNVDAFEPVALHRECFRHNVSCGPGTNMTLHDCALGNQEGKISLHTGESSSGDTYVQENGEHHAEIHKLDSFNLKQICFVKIDCEGYELYVLQGGEATIRRDKPCIIVEQKPGKGSQFKLKDTAAVDLLKSWGAVLRKEISGDFILSW